MPRADDLGMQPNVLRAGSQRFPYTHTWLHYFAQQTNVWSHWHPLRAAMRSTDLLDGAYVALSANANSR